MTRYLDTLPQPWSRKDIEAAIFNSFIDAIAAIEETKGGQRWKALQNLEDTLWIFNTSTTDLLDEICIFGDRSKNPSFWHQANVNEEGHTRAVKKKLFHCTSALMALVDHARTFERKMPVTGYINKLKATFSSPGLHDFLQCLRNYNMHWRVAKAYWTIQTEANSKTLQARFRIAKCELLEWDGWTSGARQYIDCASDEIDVYDLFSEYRRHVQSFYAWHKGAFLDGYAEDLRLYFEYKRLYDGLTKKCIWNVIVSQAPKTLNPFQYLDQYLPRHQLERLLAYEHRSDAQVEALVQMVGMKEFCDEAMYEKLLVLFRPPT
ncbi:MAG: hypothetical protein Q7T36_00965 [Fluviicoccus sp.]|uniref:hypothetical protein n=1 Tax=Fluviicoccus sp. TaxID=2003552 RepID=UPI00272224FA|nr:hypothetical protein [Fluviicoccus sp.]MDO8329024.1 hypothetical protein [Fluviicoccus sp.]